MVDALLQPCSLLWEGGIQTELFQARYSQMHQQMFSTPTEGLLLCPASSTGGFQGQQAPKIVVMYPVKIISFNQWCVQCLLLGWVLACSEERNKDQQTFYKRNRKAIKTVILIRLITCLCNSLNSHHWTKLKSLDINNFSY